MLHRLFVYSNHIEMASLKIQSLVLSLFFWMSFAAIGWSQNYKDSLNAARKAYQNGNYKQALKYYKSATHLAPKDVDLSMEAGQSAYKAGDYSTAEQYYDQAASRQTDLSKKSRAKTNVGMARMKQKNYDGAITAFKEALKANSENEKARQLLAEAQRLKKKQEEEEQKNKQQNQHQQQNNSKQQQNNPNQSQQNNQNQKQQQQQQQQQQQNKNNQQQSGQQKNGQQQLKDKATERKLDELQRQEMVTKKRVDGSKGTYSSQKAKKDW